MLDAQWACSEATVHGKYIGQVMVRCETVTVYNLLALGFHKMEIRPWDAAVSVGCHTVELSPFSCS